MEDDRAMANVRVDGAPAEATLGDGELRLRRGAAGGTGAERALSLEREVLGVQVRGKEVVVRAFVAAAAARALSCAGAATAAGGKRCRRDFVLEMADGEGAAVAWGEKLTRCLDSFGTRAFTAHQAEATWKLVPCFNLHCTSFQSN
jgi:sphingosine kinase